MKMFARLLVPLLGCMLLCLALVACEEQGTPSATPAPSAAPAPTAAPSAAPPSTMPASATPAATQPSAKAAPTNKLCPVQGHDVDASVETVMYNGKAIGFCCEDCIEPFKKDPAKYAAAMK